MRKKTNIICEICGDIHLTPNPKKTKFCLKCRHKAAWEKRDKKIIEKRNCVICNKEYYVLGKINYNKKTCGYKCRVKLSWASGGRVLGERITKNCKNCGNEFTNLKCFDKIHNIKFCSRKCMGEYNIIPSSKTKVFCTCCNKEFTKRTDHLTQNNFCTKACAYTFRKKENALWRDVNYIKDYHRNYSHINREKVIQTQKTRRSQKATTQNRLTAKEWRVIVEICGGICLKCGDKNITIDHIIPLSKGGTHCKNNVQPLCRKCNSSKGVKTIDYRPLE